MFVRRAAPRRDVRCVALLWRLLRFAFEGVGVAACLENFDELQRDGIDDVSGQPLQSGLLVVEQSHAGLGGEQFDLGVDYGHKP